MFIQMAARTIRTRCNGLLLLLAVCGLAACGGGLTSSASNGPAPAAAAVVAGNPVSIAPAIVSPPTLSGNVPPSPAAGQQRVGQTYTMTIQVPATGDTVAFTVFEPGTFVGGQTYPLIAQSHGFQGCRFHSLPLTITPPGLAFDSVAPLCSDFINITPLVQAGYGVISIDERAHGDSTGTDRVMDPDAEGADLVAVLDWVEVHLDWLAYGPSADGSDPHNLLLGAVGESYGGMFQLLVHNIDPRKRLDVIVPDWTPYDLTYSLAPNGVPKTLWDAVLFGIGLIPGQAAMIGLDPFVASQFVSSFAANTLTPPLSDFMLYHSNRYFCDGQAVATNGGPGTQPAHAPVPGPMVHALISQGMRDTLFNFNEAAANYACLKARGGDVRLITHQLGHNSLGLVPDPQFTLFHFGQDGFSDRCGTLSASDARLAFLNLHLKGQTAQAGSIPTQACMHIQNNDAVLLDSIAAGTAGEVHPVPATSVFAGGLPDVPVAVDLGTAPAAGEVVAGIPHLEVTLTPAIPTQAIPILFAGLGIQHVAGVPVYELIDNQVIPVTGSGVVKTDLVGIAARLQPGEHLVLLLYGTQQQYLLTGSISLNLANLVVGPVQVSGQVWVPRVASPVAAP